MLMRLCFAVILASVATSAFAQDVTWNVSLWGKPRAFTYHVEDLA